MTADPGYGKPPSSTTSRKLGIGNIVIPRRQTLADRPSLVLKAVRSRRSCASKSAIPACAGFRQSAAPTS